LPDYTNWEGGIRAPAWVNGGFLPAQQRGTKLAGASSYIHLCDWFCTFSKLAGGDCTDAAGDAAGLPSPDSLDMWPMISGANATSPRAEWMLSPINPGDVGNRGINDAGYIMGAYKLLLNDVPQASWCGPSYPNNSVVWDTWSTVERCTVNATAPTGARRRGSEVPKKGCLFNIIEDPTEHVGP